MDGDVLHGLFAEEFSARNAVEYTDGYRTEEGQGRKWNEQEEAELEDRLSDMGYL
jgi:hypothetical protein